MARNSNNSNELAILEEFEQRFQRLENTMKMLIDSDLDDRVATLESKICSAKQREADPMLEVQTEKGGWTGKWYVFNTLKWCDE